jgi:hypothetical protein
MGVISEPEVDCLYYEVETIKGEKGEVCPRRGHEGTGGK